MKSEVVEFGACHSLGYSPLGFGHFFEDFAGVCRHLALNCVVIERALVIALCLLGLHSSAVAQETVDAPSALTLYPPNIFSTVDSSALIHDLPLFGLLDGKRLPVSTDIGRMGTASLDLFSVAFLTSVPTQKKNTAPKAAPADAKDSPVDVINSPLHPVYSTAEVGVLYGRWSGKFSGDLWQTYMLGEVGNDKFSIIVGAEYEESSGRFPRFRSFGPPR